MYNDKINQNILQQLEAIEKADQWVGKWVEGERQNNIHRSLVDFRRLLKRKQFTLDGNPAAAIYGESQVGKSYLVSAILSSVGEPFKIFDGNGNSFDFKLHINPKGMGVESTSVVTRFTTNYKSRNSDFPVIAKILSPTDIILVICEAYYNNLNENNPLSYEDIKEKINSIEEKFSNRPKCQDFIDEDDIFGIEEYFGDNFKKLVYNNIKDANYFEKISSFVTSISPDEWIDVFPLLWNFNQQLTRLFDDLVQQHKKLDFADTVYLPIDAVLRVKGTLLDVSRLNEIYQSNNNLEPEYSADTDILFLDRNNREEFLNFSKPYLCALISEIIFVLPNDITKEKAFLRETDLLDFPGTRRFESTKDHNINDNSLTVLLRRGRVDYLFNKYSKNEQINALLFCHNHVQSTQSVIPEKLNRWIENMIGKSSAERENFKSPVPPLFIISTWFNKDLEFHELEDRHSNRQSMAARWNQRFIDTLSREIFKVDTYGWLNDWTKTKPDFQNIYLLRDFFESSRTRSQIYKGFNENGKETEEILPDRYPSFREDLKRSFLEFPFVKKHFEKPEFSWDEAASLNKDGSNLIINKLTEAANHINQARHEKSITQLKEVSQALIELLIKSYHSDDKDTELQKAKKIAGEVQHKMDTAFSADGIKNYGKFMQELMLNESIVIDFFKKTFNDPEYHKELNNDKYSAYRIHVPVIEGDTQDTYFDRLAAHYEKTSDEQKQKFRFELEQMGIDLSELISGNAELIKGNEEKLAEALLDYWYANVTLKDKDTIQQILASEGSTALEDLVNMFRLLFKKISLSKKIAERIRRYVNLNNKIDLPFEIVSDISSEMLNKCINTVGFDYFDQSDIKILIEANEKSNLGLTIENDTKQPAKSVEELFTKIEKWVEILKSRPEDLRTLPSYHNYLKWYHRLKIGFISVCDIPNYDVAANEKLGKIINELKFIKYE